jgi:sulfite reductase alpha subunit-like flavoprotein
MIGAGSGIAPFRSFWQERELQVINRTGGRRLSLASNSGIGKAILFFGCRSVKVDQLFAEEIDDLLSRGVLHEVFLALSREDGKKKRYVQHEVFKQRTLVHWLLEKEGAHVYVCGDALMADGVRKSLIKMYESEANMDELKAQDAFDDLRDDGRYHEDIYGILHPA